jgi:hypothetical protein
MLCKTTVAKNIIQNIKTFNISVNTADLFIFSSFKVFNISCEAGLLVIQLGTGNKRTCNIYDFSTNSKIREFGWSDDTFYSSINSFNRKSIFDGRCQLEWRQGIKHDCAKIMEFISTDELNFQNMLGESIRFKIGHFIYPLLKSSNIKSFKIIKMRKYVLVTQKYINEQTSTIKYIDPDVWNYLENHKSYFHLRRSIIYKISPEYSIFGVGDYSFSKYKVGISVFYKKPIFTLILGKYPIMMDDTCYFLSFDNLYYAIITLSLLNSI